INPGDLKGVPSHLREAYESHVEATCRMTGELFLQDGDILQAWRYLKTIGERDQIRAALERLEPAQATDEILGLAIREGIHPVRGFELLLESSGLCSGITTYDHDLYAPLSEQKKIAGMLVKRLYRDLVLSVRCDIQERKKPAPEETDLVDIIRSRPWVFENNNSHADPTHIAAVLRIGLIAEAQDELLMAVSIAEYAKKVPAVFQNGAPDLFDGGASDYAKYYRALLGQDAEKTAEFFCTRLAGYKNAEVGNGPAEHVLLLLWRLGKKSEALGIWENSISDVPPDLEGHVIPSFYDLCQQAGDNERLSRVAMKHHDIAAWAAAKIMASGGKPKAAPLLKEKPASAPSDDLS
ncbi:MAG TPA: hypothetical protein VEJ63_22615, partial [Planctomycetota bacterium]|nr:hypothetical protein [Planctomycetota bacterium]